MGTSEIRFLLWKLESKPFDVTVSSEINLQSWKEASYDVRW